MNKLNLSFKSLAAVFMMSAAVVASSCRKDLTGDIRDLQQQQAELATRVAALEAWKTTANNNIASLQTIVDAINVGDYVTGVTPYVPDPGGYTISFLKTPPIVILNGTNGEKGDNGADGATPQISIAEYSGAYYWTLNGEWLTDNGTPTGNKAPVTGANGSNGADGNTPTLKIDGGTWWISPDGTVGNYYDTTISATGAQGPVGSVGPAGPQGEAIFAAGGIDHTTNPDYVEFTLADNITTIKVPKYKALGITLAQPYVICTAGETKEIGATTGGVSKIKAIDLPQHWKITLNTATSKISVTAPVDFTKAWSGEVTILASDSNGNVVMSTPLDVHSGVEINGVVWSIRNVDDFGTFAATPEATGKIYQWNRKAAWAATGAVTGWENTYDTGDSWEEENDPSPAGWRVPTQAELNSLCDAEKVSNEWTTQNGVTGRLFTDIATNATLFLPAAGLRLDGGTLDGAGTFGDYWSSTADGSAYPYCLGFNSGLAGVYNYFSRSFGLFFRSVAK